MKFSPVLKLTSWYVLILMCISIFFSLAVYNITTRQVHDVLQNQAQLFQRRQFSFSFPFDPANDELLQAQAREIINRVRLTLVFVNAGILIVAGTASYFLAKRTLRPIEKNLEAQRQFTADASHELRTPLTAMKTEIEVALRDKEFPSGEYPALLRSTLEEVERLENLSRNLLHMAQFEEQEKLPKSIIDLSGALSTAQNHLAQHAKIKGITIERRDTPLVVQGDFESLVELLVILLDNAIKYSHENSHIIVSTTQTHKFGQIMIEDEGVGIEEAALPHIFDRFYRSDISRSKAKSDGFGLGLAIAKYIVEKHDGTIEVRSMKDLGTTVIIGIPLAKG